MKRVYLALLIFAFCYSCNSGSDVTTAIVGSTGHFNGNSIGNTKEMIMSNLSALEIQEEGKSIVTDQSLDGLELVTRYDFDQNVLISIQADMFFFEEASLKIFEQQLGDRYTKRMGESEEESGFKIWKLQANDTLNIEFTLADESIEFGQPKLSLTIYNFDY